MAASLCPQCVLLQSSAESECAICGASIGLDDVDKEKAIAQNPTHLMIHYNGQYRADYPLEKQSTLIGRQDRENAQDCTLDLSQYDSEFVHRRHAEICWSDGQQVLAIRHLGGRNITQVNEQIVPENEWVELFVGDQVLVGKVSLVVGRKG